MHEIYRKFPVLVGLRVMDAVPIIKSQGFVMRIAIVDDKKISMCNDFAPLRINLNIQKGIVYSYTFH